MKIQGGVESTKRVQGTEVKKVEDDKDLKLVPVSVLKKEEDTAKKDEQKPLDEQTLKKLTDGLNQFMTAMNKGLDFEIHEETKRLMVKVVDRDTDKVIREIPPEEMLDLVARIDKMLGLFVDETV